MEASTEESTNGIRFSWNVFPYSKTDLAKIAIPLGFHYTPAKKTDNLQTGEYDPVYCKGCKSVLNLQFHVDFRSKSCDCCF